MRLISVLAACAAIAVAAPASATEVFSDGFEGDAPGIGLTTLTNWVITSGNNPTGGTVDIVGAVNPYGITVTSPASGNVLDLDGTPGPAAIYSKLAYNFNAGDLVTFSYDVGGSQRDAASDVFVAGMFVDPALVGLFSGTGFTSSPGILNNNQLSGSLLLNGLGTPFTTSSISFRALGAGSLKMAFYTTSGDNVGPLVDNVRLDIAAVPEPATWALMLFGFAFVGGAMRSRRKPHLAARYA
ncbi:PEPxxWA-CTERM sorting domain-containing protein [Sphingopyxis sp.]|uniref:PEPxxWA-CTERM sorting domain-containing protein n=1 Tax=Sphingopyxis sp. TaxID=1908224 RepID=UPI003BABC4E7